MIHKFSSGEASTLGKTARVPQTSGSPTKKSKTIAMDRTVRFIPNSYILMFSGKQCECNLRYQEKNEWFERIIATYDGLKGKFGIYFPSDGKTHFASLDDEDLEVIE